MATTQHEIYERARLARDPRFDGRFFIAVRTTGIYCRPVCPANAPRSENVTFFPTAAAAAEAGYRPCLRCRPETAPGTPAWAGTSTTVQRGLRLISNGALDDGNLEALSDRLGVSSRHLRRLFREHLGASPQAVAHTQRLHFAKRLLDETCLPMHQVAEAAGYGSVRRFNDAFRNSYGRAPRELRKIGTEEHALDPASPMSVTLTYRQPFEWPVLLRYFSLRGIPSVESVDGEVYRRSYRLGDSRGILEVCPDQQPGRLRLTLHGMTTANLYQAVQKTREMLDLDAPVEDISRVLAGDRLLHKRLRTTPGIRVPGAFDGFELAVRTIIGQQVSVAGASTLAGRVAHAWGESLGQPDGASSESPSLLFPTPDRLQTASLEEAGIIGSRANAIRSMASAVLNGELSFDCAQEPAEFCKALTSIKGIGDWTAQYLSIRILKDPDAFPASDLGLQKAVVPGKRLTPSQLRSRAEDWRPWRAYAAMLLWQGPEQSGG
jgi:AraC family transcriptional regulator of adaptative response / DNA-3-methyladenine glycosylase II